MLSEQDSYEIELAKKQYEERIPFRYDVDSGEKQIKVNPYLVDVYGFEYARQMEFYYKL